MGEGDLFHLRPNTILNYENKYFNQWNLLVFDNLSIMIASIVVKSIVIINWKAVKFIPIILLAISITKRTKEFTNKWICLVAFLICMFIMFFLSDYIKEFWQMILMYVIMLTLMVGVFFKQLVHDFKIFKSYMKEYLLLSFKTWLKSLLIM